MLNPFLNFRTVQGKVEDALKRKFVDMFPCTAKEWEASLDELGIFVRDASEGASGGFLRVTNPMGIYLFNAQGDAIGTCQGVLYVPDEVAERILVLGDLP